MDIDTAKLLAFTISVLIGVCLLGYGFQMESLSACVMGFAIPLGMFFAIVLLPSTLVSTITGTEVDTGPTRTSHDLRALTTSTEVTGSGGGNILIASATVDEVAVYRFYQEDKNGGITLRTVDASDVTLYEDGRSEVVDVDYGLFRGEAVELHVPAGSIVDEVDLTLPTN